MVRASILLVNNVISIAIVALLWTQKEIVQRDHDFLARKQMLLLLRIVMV